MVKRAHFIAIGDIATFNLALALQNNGVKVTGSDEQILEPTRTRLQKCGIVAENLGYSATSITDDIGVVIIGVHARFDNPELQRARELGLKILSVPEFIYEHCKNKTRIVIGGSHGKTTITSMIIHTLAFNDIKCDFLVGAQLDGYDAMVSLSDDAKYVIIEGDEYLASALDPRPKFLIYRPNIALITGIAWDHVNVYPSFDIYIDQFKKFIDSLDDKGTLIYHKNDPIVNRLARESDKKINKIAYDAHPYEIFDNRNFLIIDSGRVPLYIFGEHNMQNVAAAFAVCVQLNVADERFYNAMKEYKGASRRLQLIGNNQLVNIYWDYAHSPSKLSATIKAVRVQFPERELIACMELSTMSSLNEHFVEQYSGTMDLADVKIVYYNPELVQSKGLKEMNTEQVKAAFGNPHLKVYTQIEHVVDELNNINWKNKNLLLMSSGNFSGLSLNSITKMVLGE